jgi:hypothetical protein
VVRTLEDLAEVVAPSVLVDAIETSTRLANLGVPHALIGGLAVGLHGHPRATKDVDFLVGNEALEQAAPLLVFREELREIVRVGVIDLLPVAPEQSGLREALRLPDSGEIPLIPIEQLVHLKLLANRPQDRADISVLMTTGLDVGTITRYLRRHAPDLLPRFAELLPGEELSE